MRSLRQRVEGSFPARCVRSFTRLGGLDRVMVISSQAFTALIPVMLVTSAFLPVGEPDAVSGWLIRKLGLSGDAAKSVEQVFGNADADSVGLLSLLLLAYSGVSFTKRMQRMYLHAWRFPVPQGIAGSTSAALGLLAIIGQVAVLSLLRGMVERLPWSWVLASGFSVAASLVLWTSIPWLLLGRRTEWRRLLPGGLLTGVAVTLYGIATTVYMPRLIEIYSDRYGLFGVTIAVVSWLLCVAFIVVTATVVAAEVDQAPERWAQRVRVWVGVEARQALVHPDARDLDA